MIDLELRKKALTALDWDVIEDQFLSNDTQRMIGMGRRPGRGTTEFLPVIEHDPAVSEPLFLEWCAKNKYDTKMETCSSGLQPSVYIGIWPCDSDDEDKWHGEGETPSTARALAIVAASEKA